MSREFIRRNEKELKEFKDNIIKEKYTLKEQLNFKGTKEELELMQFYEKSYRDGKPIISDEEWDRLVKETNYEESFDEIVSQNGRKWVKLGAPLGSLKKINNIEKLIKFLSNKKDIIVEPKLDGLTFNAIYKNINEEYILDCITTRGDGLNGLKLNEKALYGVEKIFLPEKLSKNNIKLLKKEGYLKNNKLEISGECVINKNDWANNWEEIVPRSIVAGIFNRKEPNNLNYIINKFFPLNNGILNDIKIKKNFKKSTGINILNYNEYKRINNNVYLYNNENNINITNEIINNNKEDEFKNRIRITEKLYFFSYGIVKDNNRIDDPELFEKLEDFVHPLFHKDFKDISGFYYNNIEEIIFKIDNMYGTTNFVRDTNKFRIKNNCKFPLDGIVIKPKISDTITQNMKPYVKGNKLIIPKYPEDQIAIKLSTDPSITKILKINYNKTKLGNITVTADIEPTKVEGGSIISKINLHNPEWLKMKENSFIKEGNKVLLYMGNDIIPILQPYDESKIIK